MKRAAINVGQIVRLSYHGLGTADFDGSARFEVIEKLPGRVVGIRPLQANAAGQIVTALYLTESHVEAA